MTKELLIKFLNNTCNSAELEEVVRWAKEISYSSESRQMVLEDWNTYEPGEEGPGSGKFSSMLDKIHHKINIEYNERRFHKYKEKTYSLVLTWITRAAAILLLPVLSFLFYTLHQKPVNLAQKEGLAVDSLEIIAPFGSRTVVELTDGSLVHLNSGSKIKYPQIFSDNTREVVLVGEGYFDVASNPEKPFIVKAGALEIKAIGTEFNVLAYPDQDIIATTLVEGKVFLEKMMMAGVKEKIGAMVPDQHVSFNARTGKIISEAGNIYKYIAWKDGKMVFENESITRVTERLNRLFNVDIRINENVKEYTFNNE